MALTAEGVTASIQRILAILGKNAHENLPAYVKSILEACGWMDPTHFDEAAQAIVKAWKNPWRPKPTDYRAYYDIAVDRTPKPINAPRPSDTEASMRESVEWCLLQIEQKYTPEAAYDHLQWLNDNPNIAGHITQPVMLALIHKSGTADPEKLSARKASREKAKAFRDILKNAH